MKLRKASRKAPLLDLHDPQDSDGEDNVSDDEQHDEDACLSDIAEGKEGVSDDEESAPGAASSTSDYRDDDPELAIAGLFAKGSHTSGTSGTAAVSCAGEADGINQPGSSRGHDGEYVEEDGADNDDEGLAAAFNPFALLDGLEASEEASEEEDDSMDAAASGRPDTGQAWAGAGAEVAGTQRTRRRRQRRQRRRRWTTAANTNVPQATEVHPGEEQQEPEVAEQSAEDMADEVERLGAAGMDAQHSVLEGVRGIATDAADTNGDSEADYDGPPLLPCDTVDDEQEAGCPSSAASDCEGVGGGNGDKTPDTSGISDACDGIQESGLDSAAPVVKGECWLCYGPGWYTSCEGTSCRSDARRCGQADAAAATARSGEQLSAGGGAWALAEGATASGGGAAQEGTSAGCIGNGGDASVEAEELVAPCSVCAGGLRYIHRRCFQRWLETSWAMACPNCRTLYDSSVLDAMGGNGGSLQALMRSACPPGYDLRVPFPPRTAVVFCVGGVLEVSMLCGEFTAVEVLRRIRLVVDDLAAQGGYAGTSPPTFDVTGLVLELGAQAPWRPPEATRLADMPPLMTSDDYDDYDDLENWHADMQRPVQAITGLESEITRGDVRGAPSFARQPPAATREHSFTSSTGLRSRPYVPARLHFPPASPLAPTAAAGTHDTGTWPWTSFRADNPLEPYPQAVDDPLLFYNATRRAEALRGAADRALRRAEQQQRRADIQQQQRSQQRYAVAPQARAGGRRR